MLDLNEVLAAGLAGDRRPPDGLLHPSTDLAGPLRHTMLREAGAPEYTPNTIAGNLRLRFGTLFHKDMEAFLQQANAPSINELNIRAGLPAGWSGTADLILWDEEIRAFRLIDFKTMKGEGFAWLSHGAKPEHVMQVSAYWHALVEMGYPMANETHIWYVPFNEDYRVEGGVQPLLIDVTPLPKEPLWGEMNDRWAAVMKYLDGIPPSARAYVDNPGAFITPDLAPVMPPEQKLLKKGATYDVVLMPTWHAMFCPYHDDLCPCGTLPNGNKSQKLGSWAFGQASADEGGWFYTPIIDVEPLVFPPGYQVPVTQ